MEILAGLLVLGGVLSLVLLAVAAIIWFLKSLWKKVFSSFQPGDRISPARVSDDAKKTAPLSVLQEKASENMPLQQKKRSVSPAFQVETKSIMDNTCAEAQNSNSDFVPLAGKIDEAYREIGKKIFGMEDIIEQCMIALFSGGHVLCEGLPGLAKTTLAKAFSEVFSCEFKRCQFSPDLLPSDLLGDRIYNQVKNSFEFQPGPVFTQILLADEINRSPAKTQAALLEVMQESQVTLWGTRHLIGAVSGLEESVQTNRIFCTIATQNPVEQEGTYRLPEAQLDRFMFRLFFDWPSRENELAVLNSEGVSALPVTPCFTAPEIVFWKNKIAAEVHVPEKIKEMIVDIVRATRHAEEIAVGAGPRASQVLLRGAKAAAAFAGRSYVTEEDVRHLVFPVLNHRLIVKPEVLFEHPDQTGKSLLENIIRKISSQVNE